MPATIVKAGTRVPLNVLGMPLTMLCEAGETGGAWSLFEEEVALGMHFEIDGEPVKSAKGDFNYLPRNTVHGFKGASDTPARVLIFAAPAHGSEFFRELNDEIQSLPEDGSKIPGIGQRHGIQFMPAPVS